MSSHEDTCEDPTPFPHSHADHSHAGHGHEAGASRGRLTAAMSVTGLVLVAELIAALLSGSLSLAADAGHMAVDSAGLLIALIAAHLMARPRSGRRTWGWARAEVVAAALQAGMLMIICVSVAIEGVMRLLNPEPIASAPMLIVGVVGLVANIVSLAILAGGRSHNLNMRAAFLEVANDALGSIAVIAAALVQIMTGWERADSVASLLIATLMAPRAFALLRSSLAILLEETPSELDIDELRTHMEALPGVERVHDLHVSSVSSTLVTLSAHVLVSPMLDSSRRDQLVHDLGECVAHHFPIAIGHSTFQLESGEHAAHEHLHH